MQKIFTRMDRMKKWFAAILLLAVCSAATAFADGTRMTVVNCTSWVSLREKPDAASKRLTKVYLGETLEDCRPAENDFVACTYGDLQGYIKSDYLQQDRETADGFAELPELPACKDLKKVGETVLDASKGGYRVVAQRAWKDGHEELLAVCYDRNLKPLWTVDEVSPESAAELPATSAFFAGTADSPALIVFVSGKGFAAYTLGKEKRLRWTLETDAVGGGLSSAVREDGTIYTVGYYNTAPVCISDAGQLLWQGVNDDPACYWPCQLEADGEGVRVTYESGTALYFSDAGNHCGA